MARFDKDGVSGSNYLTLSPSKWVVLKSPEEFGEEFRHLFEKSVSKAIASHQSLGAQLSGGLDSSSVVSMARHLRPDSELNCFFIDNEGQEEISDPKLIDKWYCREVIQATSSNLHIINRQGNRLKALVKFMDYLHQPPMTNGLPELNAVFSEAGNTGSTVLLTGYDGDSIVGSGRGYIEELWNSKNWDALKQCVVETARLDKLSAYRTSHTADNLQHLITVNYFVKKLIQDLKDKSLRRFFRSFSIASDNFGVSRATLLHHLGMAIYKKYLPQGAVISKSILRPDLERENLSSLPKPDLSDTPFYDSILVNQNVRILEEYYHLGKHFNIIPEHPFFDVELYELCLATPQKFKYDHARGRGQLRMGMKGILPEAVRNRTNKSIGIKRPAQAALELFDESGDFLSPSATIWNFIDRQAFFHNALLLRTNKLPDNTNFRVAFETTRTINLAVWLSQHHF